MGCATSNLAAGGRSSRKKRSDPELAENKQNNHIIKDDKLDQFTDVHGKEKEAGCGTGSEQANRPRSGCERKSIQNGAGGKQADASCAKQVVLFRPVLAGFEKCAGIKISTLKVSIDKKPTSLDEKSSAVLKYRTPHFRASAVVEIPDLKEDKVIRIGWIQTCSRMQFINTYGKEGVTSWEFPEIVSGKYQMISDADGKQYPWYGSRHEIQTVRGPCSRQSVTVHMNDNFFPQVTWYIPHSAYDRSPRLTNIHREQHFYTFLVAKDLSTGAYHVLKTITWSMTINIAVDPDSPLGRRSRLLEPLEQKPPVIVNGGRISRPETYAMKPPNANNAQVLVWRPLVGEPKIVVPAEETTVNMEKYLQNTKDYLRHSEYQLRET